MSKQISPQWYGTFLASLSAILLGFVGFLGTRLIHDDFAIPDMLFWRFLTAAIVIGLVLLIRQRLHANDKHFLKYLHELTLAAFIYSLACAAYFVSAQHIGTGLSAAVFFSFPVFVTGFSYLFGTVAIDRFTLISLLAICAGIYFVHGNYTSAVNGTGLLFALVSAFLYATYVYRSRAISKVLEPAYLTLLVCIGSTIIFSGFAAFAGELMLPEHPVDWFYIFALGVFGTALPIQLLLESLKYISPVKVSILASLQVITTVLLGWMLLNEQITLPQLGGILLLLSGAIIIQKDHKS